MYVLPKAGFVPFLRFLCRTQGDFELVFLSLTS